ncbi:MAG: ACP S-malonyltransferase [Pirellulaceae bacterium]
MPTALLFPGQGAQNVGMGATLVARSSEARRLFETASEILGYDLLKLCSDGPLEQLSRTEFGQPALFVHSYAAMRQLEIEQPTVWESVSSVAGLSLGEYTAVAVAGGFSFESGVRLVHARGQAMQEASDLIPSGMSSVIGLELEQLEEVCRAATSESATGEFVQVANLLCPGNTAISGHLAALEIAERLSVEAGAMKAIRLQVAGAFHTAIMQPAVAKLKAALAEVEFSPTRVPVVSNVDAAPHTDPDQIRPLLPQQVIEPVRWEQSLRTMIDSGVDRFIEVGTGRVLAGTLKRIQRKLPCENYGDS